MGAQMMSLKKGEREYIWQGDEKYWAGRTPVLFPVAGAFRDEIYVVNGEKYPFPKHGFIKNKLFTIFSKTENSVTLVRKEDEETLKTFPFKFSFYVTFILKEGLMEIAYKVVNEDTKTMYFSTGAHEGYALEDDFENYSILFKDDKDLVSCNLEGKVLGKTTRDFLNCNGLLPLKYDYFSVDALVFRHINSHEVSLLHNGKVELTVECPDSNNLLLWTKPGAKYICIEPWVKSPDFVDSEYEVSLKEDIVSLEPSSCYIFNHSIRIN